MNTPTSCPPPHPHPRVPRLRPPSGAIDAHCHVFGPGHLFPYAEGRTFTPPDVSEDDLRRRHDHLGLDRALIVQSSCHGTDHSALLDALRTGGGRYRGVALVTPGTPPEEIARLHEAGVRGARLNFMPHLGQSPSPETIRAVTDLVGPFSWHLGVHVAGTGIADLEDVIRAIEIPVVIDHMARVDLRDGLASEPVRALKRLLGEGGVWVKLSGADRLTHEGPPYGDSAALARALAAHAPERVVWGTDFPHPNIRGAAPDDGLLVDLLDEIAPSEELRRRILVDTPAALFGFG
ncbi:amidohydrolase [Actinomadura darangshiensis]|uniref:Amidohydrolase n=1 Tax=Actinomadura darangshiensis TaxID=705336 RepID=A0A4R5BNP6_9ACTN|nr:amidohydrolase family protein [Actinomadura darangshiensis]TDD88481.1 amidohydrolase [Actinomadura darangshiensis]